MSCFMRGLRFPLLALVVLLAPAGTVFASQACEGVDTKLTEARRGEYSKLVSSAMGASVAAADVSLGAFMQSGDWSAVYASTPVADDGVLFFQVAGGAKRFRDAWGGAADESGRGELEAWASGLGAPEELARCFADRVIRGN